MADKKEYKANSIKIRGSILFSISFGYIY